MVIDHPFGDKGGSGGRSAVLPTLKKLLAVLLVVSAALPSCPVSLDKDA